MVAVRVGREKERKLEVRPLGWRGLGLGRFGDGEDGVMNMD